MFRLREVDLDLEMSSMSSRFNENTRVQVPAAIHLCRLGYTYLDVINEEDYEPSTIQKIVDTFLEQKAEDGFSVVVSHDEIAAKGYTLSAGQYFDVKIEYVPITADEFAAKIAGFKSRLAELNEKGAELDRQIAANLDSFQFNPEVGKGSV